MLTPGDWDPDGPITCVTRGPHSPQACCSATSSSIRWAWPRTAHGPLGELRNAVPQVATRAGRRVRQVAPSHRSGPARFRPATTAGRQDTPGCRGRSRHRSIRPRRAAAGPGRRSTTAAPGIRRRTAVRVSGLRSTAASWTSSSCGVLVIASMVKDKAAGASGLPAEPGQPLSQLGQRCDERDAGAGGAACR
jgi:hypothetical protein